jgi:cytoskeletal protein CcmA (bactofilin family)
LKEEDMKKHILKGLVLLPLVLMVVLLAATPAMAADLRSDDTVIISSGDVIDDDLYIAANKIIINGVVNGDVLSVGSTITVTGKINGSIIAIGSTINIGGEITESVRVAGSSVTVTGTIGGDLVTAVSDLDIEKGAIINRDLVFAASDIDVDAPISQEITGWGSRVTIRDIVGGDVEIGVERLIVASTAEIKGDLVYYSEDQATIESGAQIGGTTTHEPMKYRMPDFPIIHHFRIWGAVIGFLMALIPGIIIILIAPRRAKAVAEAIKTKPLLSLGWGALILIATPIAILIICVTIIGIPLGIIGGIFYLLVIFLSQIAFGLFIGYWILSYARNVDSKGTLILAFLLGFVLLTLIKLIPYIGPFIWVVTTIFGIGAMVISNKTMPSGDEPEVIEAHEE